MDLFLEFNEIFDSVRFSDFLDLLLDNRILLSILLENLKKLHKALERMVDLIVFLIQATQVVVIILLFIK